MRVAFLVELNVPVPTSISVCKVDMLQTVEYVSVELFVKFGTCDTRWLATNFLSKALWVIFDQSESVEYVSVLLLHWFQFSRFLEFNC